MHRVFRSVPVLAALALTTLATAARADVTVGNKAPDFTLSTTDGKKVSLHDFAGKTVVLEWFNPDCPFVKFAHGDKGPLVAQPKRATGEGVVWLAVNSSAPGKQGNGTERNVKAAKEYGMSYPILLDSDGKVGKLYGAKTTPHMYVIDKEGVLRYNGALDNAPLGKADGSAINFVDAAIKGVATGKVEKAQTEAYGCSVKYDS
ncbi:MAG: thioredoxin family protein [Myxococcota bacterium]|nr:thioredoxin family protein [Myxococcota bacterium]